MNEYDKCNVPGEEATVAEHDAATRLQPVVDQLHGELARYQERNPAAAEALRIFEQTDRIFQRSLAALDQVRIVISDSSYGPQR